MCLSTTQESALRPWKIVRKADPLRQSFHKHRWMGKLLMWVYTLFPCRFSSWVVSVHAVDCLHWEFLNSRKQIHVSCEAQLFIWNHDRFITFDALQCPPFTPTSNQAAAQRMIQKVQKACPVQMCSYFSPFINFFCHKVRYKSSYFPVIRGPFSVSTIEHNRNGKTLCRCKSKFVKVMEETLTHIVFVLDFVMVAHFLFCSDLPIYNCF